MRGALSAASAFKVRTVKAVGVISAYIGYDEALRCRAFHPAVLTLHATIKAQSVRTEKDYGEKKKA
jgi:hypothetical protein